MMFSEVLACAVAHSVLPVPPCGDATVHSFFSEVLI